MGTAGSILTKAQEYLHDDGTIWSRAELLDALNDGLQRLLSSTRALRRLQAIETPPRYARTITHPWEAQHAPGTPYRFTHETVTRGSTYQCTYAWEVEHNLGATPANSEAAYTHPWERTIASDVTDRADVYPLPADMLQIVRVHYNDRRRPGTNYQELDQATAATWETEGGDPGWHHRGLRTVKQFAIYPEVSAYTQSVACVGRFGTLRAFSGSLTYAYAADRVSGHSGGKLFGVPRRYRGTREYLAAGDVLGDGPRGTVRQWTGSTGSILLDYAVNPTPLAEEDSPPLPAAFDKYLRYYVLSKAFGRDGEGHQEALESHFLQRFEMGVALLRRMAQGTMIARTWQRQRSLQPAARTTLARLPSHYPAVRT